MPSSGPSDPRPAVAKESDIIVVDLGAKKRKQIKELHKGQGKLMERVKQCVAELKASGTVAASAIPIVIVVEEKREATDIFGMLKS